MTSARVTTEPTTATERTYALEGGASASTFVGAGMAIAGEDVALHLYLATVSQLLAWTITSLNATMLIWLWRSYRAQARPVLQINDSDVEIRFGKVLRLRFPRSSIATVDAATWRSVPDVAANYVNAAKPLEPNVTIVLDPPAHAKLPFGISKRVSRLDLRVANAAGVIEALRKIVGGKPDEEINGVRLP